MENKGKKIRTISAARFPFKVFLILPILLTAFFASACSELEKPKTEPFYAETVPPPKQEFRWSNGKMPKSFDPALASASPETDIVRALFEGLTDVDPKTLAVAPSIATEWSASENNHVWTFKLRRDAKWSNGKTITAEDFVRSWTRLAAISDKVSHPILLANIVGMPAKPEEKTAPSGVPEFLTNTDSGKVSANSNTTPAPNANSSIISPKYEVVITDNLKKNPAANSAPTSPPPTTAAKIDSKKAQPKEPKFGVEAVDDYTLKVSLVNADKDFPQLVAHPMFRPVFGSGGEFETEKLNAEIVTSGAFRIGSIGQDGITLDRAEHFWNKKEVALERVKFVPSENAEKALAAYREGTIDAVTNVNFEPLAVKLLQPYDDFQRITYGALNFYEFNRKNAPFNDRRVREALAIAIVRERLTEGEMEGTSKPALSFSPFDESSSKLTQDVAKAKNLLTAAGFPDGENFPTVRLVVNRNNLQQKIANSVAKMWKENLNIETEVITKESNELASVKASGEFDVMRRGVVLPTSDEASNMLAIFEPKIKPATEPTPGATKKEESIEEIFDRTQETMRIGISENAELSETPDTLAPVLAENTEPDAEKLILTEESAIVELHAIPLYFPTAYSLVKPYVQGFEMNSLDAPSLKNVTIDNGWQPKKAKGQL